MSTAAVTTDPYAAYGGKVASGGGADPYAAYGGKVAQPPAASPQKGFASSFADSSGLSALAHPIDTILGLPAGIRKMASDTVSNVKQGVADYQKEGLTDKTRRDFGRAVPIVGPVLAEAQGQHDAGNNAGMAGTIAGTVAGFAAPEAASALKPAAVLEKAAPALRATGEAAEAAGNKLINETVGAYKKDFNRGANPGRGYNEAVGGPSLSMRSLANKADAVKNQTGEAIGKVIDKSAAKDELIPINDVVDALSKPLKEQYDIEAGPGGMGNTEVYDKYAQGFKNDIQKGIKNGGLTAQEVFDLKRNIAKRAKFSNTTPEGIMDVRQGQVGALGGLLTEKIPELADLNRNYQDLVGLADRAAWRAESGSRPLSGLVREGAKATGMMGAGLTHSPVGLAAAGAVYALDTVPGKTAIASGLFKGGQGLTSIADRIDQLRNATKTVAKPSVSNPIERQAVSPLADSTAATVIQSRKIRSGNQ